MRSRKNKQGPPIVYDPDAHREFVTGFRRRKQARRQTAAAKALAAEKEARREERRAKREVFRSRVEQGEDDVKSEEEGEQKMSYEGEGNVLVTASVTPLETNFGALRNTGRSTKGKEEENEKTGEGTALKTGHEEAKDAVVEPLKGVLASRVAKVRKSGRRRKVSYTHLLSKGNKRKAQLRRRSAK